MKAQIKKIDKNEAIRLLSKNTANRKVKKTLLNYLSHQMSSGLWKQNGESIIIDKNGIIKDGQHRLSAIVKSNFSDYFVVVTEVDNDTFETIDTGLSRTLKDIFHVNGYKNEGLLASCTTMIFGIQNSLKTGDMIYSKDGQYAYTRSGVRILEGNNKTYGNNEKYSFFKKHENYIKFIISEVESLYRRQPIKIVGKTVICGFLHKIRQFKIGNCTQITEFMEELLGINTFEGSAPNFLYKRFLQQKVDKSTKYTSEYLNNVFARSWNDYQNGNLVKSYRITKDSIPPKLNTSLLIFED